jgi:hypothetical protein
LNALASRIKFLFNLSIIILMASFLVLKVSRADPLPDPTAAASTTESEAAAKQNIIKTLHRANAIACSSGTSCSLPGSEHPSLPDEKVCRAKYAKLYANPEITVTAAFGYFDGRPDKEVYAGYFAQNFITEMIAPCENAPHKNFCGFARDPDDASRFTKSVIGPDQKPHEFKINVVSPITPGEIPNDDLIRNTAEQKSKDAKARAEFLAALQTDNIVMYDGHARDGGGPDFNPPVLNPKTQDTDYNYYHAKHPGLNDMLAALTTSKRHPDVLALMTCDAKLHFEKQLKKTASDSALALTNMVTDSNVFQAGEIGLMDGLMSQRCDDQFVPSMELADQPLYEDQPKKGLAPPIDFEGWGVRTPNVVPAPAR